MNNKYNLNYTDAMNVANKHLDILEDTMNEIRDNYKEQVELYEPILHEVLLAGEDMLYVHLSENNYQEVCNQLLLNEMNRIFLKDALPENDLEIVNDYLYFISEEMLIHDVTRVIDNFNK